MSNLANEYKASIAPALMKKFGYKSVMQIPKLDKVVINVGAGEAKDNSKVIDAIINDLGKIISWWDGGKYIKSAGWGIL